MKITFGRRTFYFYGDALNVEPFRQAAGPRCLYIFRDLEDEVIYVGQTWDPYTRFRAHRRKPWWPSVHTVQVIEVQDNRYLSRLEKLTIARYSPKHNRLRYRSAS